MKVLIIDLETSPNVSYTWGLFNQNIGHNQLVTPSHLLCFAAKWWKKKTVFYYKDPDGHQEMVMAARALMTEADVVVHWNGDRFDIPVLNREFLSLELSPPAPSKQVDLYKVSKRTFAFPSHKLDYVARALDIGQKLPNPGMEMWKGCLAGEEKSWRLMKKYNIQDVILTEQIYEKFLPWGSIYPNVQLYDYIPDGCPRCGKSNLIKEGFAYTSNGKYQRYRCNSCGGWSQGIKRVEGVEIK